MLRLIRTGVLVLAVVAAPLAVQAQGRPLPSDASQPLKQAGLLLEQIRQSNIDRSWRANALARMARSQARAGDENASRILGRDLVGVLYNETATSGPTSIPDAVNFAIMSQAYADLRDPVTTTEAANAALKVIGTDPGVRAATLPLVAMSMVDIGNKAAAGDLALEGLRSAASLPSGRDQLAALAAIAQVQAKLGDREAALGTAQAAKASLPANVSAGDRAIGQAQIARAFAAAGDTATARTTAREAIRTYDQSVNDQTVSMGQRVTALALIAIAQAEAGDKSTARQIMGVARQTMSGVTGQYEQMIALLTLADASLIVER